MCRYPSAGRSSPWWCPMRRASRRPRWSWCAGADDTGRDARGSKPRAFIVRIRFAKCSKQSTIAKVPLPKEKRMLKETNGCLRTAAGTAPCPGKTARSHHEMRKWMKGVGVALFVSALAPGTAPAQVPGSASLATHAVASLYHAIGTGIATVVSRHTPMTVRVQPFAGPPAWLPSMDKGDTDMGVLTSADAVTSYNGINPYKRPFKNIRILL